jgi:hypothetical protein|tara:strand:- start:10335 stop:11057 length:723 start_codon:yes stop_codon:yes gene_type:complete
MELKKQILSALGLNSEEEIQLGFQAKTEDGTIVVSTAEELENGVDISVLTEDGTTIKLPPGTYKLDTGVSFRVEEEGIVAEVIESETEEEETPKEEEMSEELGEDRGEDDDEAAVDDWEGMEKRIKNLEDAVADLKEKMGKEDEYEDEVEEEEMSKPEPGKNPRSRTTKTTEVVEFSNDEFTKLKEENEKLKAELAKQPASAPLDTNKFSSNEENKISKLDLSKLSKRERILHNFINNNN